jgi:hypothetical protein
VCGSGGGNSRPSVIVVVAGSGGFVGASGRSFLPNGSGTAPGTTEAGGGSPAGAFAAEFGGGVATGAGGSRGGVVSFVELGGTIGTTACAFGVAAGVFAARGGSFAGRGAASTGFF